MKNKNEIPLRYPALDDYIFTELFPVRFRLNIHDMITGSAHVCRNDFVISTHILFGHLVVNIRLLRTYNVQVKNAVAWKEKNR